MYIIGAICLIAAVVLIGPAFFYRGGVSPKERAREKQLNIRMLEETTGSNRLSG